jgi:hypothetical protein
MPKPSLRDDVSKLESEVIETMLAGLKEWRADLSYPESHSDMQGCFRALYRMFDMKRRPLAIELPIRCENCKGAGKFVTQVDRSSFKEDRCQACGGRGWN